MAKTRWPNAVLASFEVLKQSAQSHQFKGLVWPDEGEFHGEAWIFNEAHAGEYEPLVLDIITASMMLALHDALEKPENQAKFKEWIGKSRGHFAKLHELTMEKVQITGFKSK